MEDNTTPRAHGSPLGSPYLGPTSADYRVKESSGRASEGVKAIIKLCRTGSTWRKNRTHSPEMWAPTLASYFQCLEATLTNPCSALAATTTSSQHNGRQGRECVEQQDQGSIPAVDSCVEAQTRLPYTMPSLYEQKQQASIEYCGSPSAEFSSSCLGVKFSPARFISRNENWSDMECAVTWNDTRHLSKHLSHSAPTNNIEDGYRSPAYAATLELLSPSAELITKKKKMLGSSRAINLVLPSSASTQRRTHLVVSILSEN